jgi:hypothetical protein
MAFILWRHNQGNGSEEYVTGWAHGGLASYSSDLKSALQYETYAAAGAAIANRGAEKSEWHIREVK